MGPLAYITGIRFNLVSPLSLDEVKERLRIASGSKFNPVSMGVKARVLGNHVQLRWKVPLVNDWMSPLFVGKLENDLGRTRYRAKFVPSLRARLFLIVCFLISSLVLFGLLTGWLSGELLTRAEVYFNLAVAGLFAAPVLVQALANVGAKANLADILDFLQRAAILNADEFTDP